jgi:hypothetical protein
MHKMEFSQAYCYHLVKKILYKFIGYFSELYFFLCNLEVYKKKNKLRGTVLDRHFGPQPWPASTAAHAVQWPRRGAHLGGCCAPGTCAGAVATGDSDGEAREGPTGKHPGKEAVVSGEVTEGGAHHSGPVLGRRQTGGNTVASDGDECLGGRW